MALLSHQDQGLKSFQEFVALLWVGDPLDQVFQIGNRDRGFAVVPAPAYAMVDKPASAHKLPKSRHVSRALVNMLGVIMARLSSSMMSAIRVLFRSDRTVSDSTATVILYTRCGDLTVVGNCRGGFKGC